MTIQTSLDKHGGNFAFGIEWTPDSGVTYYRWAGLTIDSGGLYEPRVISWGSHDRRVSGTGPIPYDITIEVSNTDGALDGIVTALTDTTANIMRADATLYIINLDDLTETLVIGKFAFGALLRAGVDGILTLHFEPQANNYFGTIELPTVKEVLDGLALVDSAVYGGYSLVPGMADQLVPIAYGQFGNPYFDDYLEAHPAALLTDGSRCYLLGMSPFGYDLQYDAQQRVYIEDGMPGNDWVIVKAAAVIRHGNFAGNTYYTKIISENPTGVAGKCLVVRTMFGTAESRVRAPALSFATNGAGSGIEPPITTVIENILDDYTSDPGRWTSTYVDTASFVKVAKQIGRVRGRAYITENINAFEWLQQQASNIFELFYDNTARLAVLSLEQEGVGYTYSSAHTVQGRYDVLGGDSWAIPDDNLPGGMTNLYQIISAAPLRGDHKTYSYKDDTSISRNGRVTKALRIGPSLLASEESCRTLALSKFDITRDPSRILSLEMSARGFKIGLGDLILFNHPNLPGYSTPRYLQVIAQRLNLDDMTCTIKAIDRHDFLTRRVYIVNDESNYLTIQPSGAQTLVVGVADSAIRSGVAVFTGAMKGDWLCIGGWPGGYRTGAGKNNLWCKIVLVISTTHATLATGGGENGVLPSYSEAAIPVTEWRIYRDRANYAVNASSYVAQLEKYGAVCGVDGMFTDDTEPGFVMGEGT